MPNSSSRPFPTAEFTDPTPYGYLYLGFTVDPPSHVPVVRASAVRERAISDLVDTAGELDALPQVVKASTFRAVFIPPIADAPRFDVVLLIRTNSPEAVADVQASRPYGQLRPDSVIAAHNTRRIGATEPFAMETPGTSNGNGHSATYLFNHFTAEDPDRATAAWESLTGWYLDKTGVDNSTLLRPMTASPYAVINYVRLPVGPPRFLLRQFLRPSFTTFVRSTLREHGMTALPVFFTPVAENHGSGPSRL